MGGPADGDGFHAAGEHPGFMFERLAALLKGGSATVVLVEHRVDAAWPLATVVLALDGDGAPIDVGKPAQVLRRSRKRLAAAGIWLPGESPKAPEPVAGPGTGEGAIGKGAVCQPGSTTSQKGGGSGYAAMALRKRLLT